MATVEADFDLYSCAQGRATTDEYYKIFTSTVDTINANGGNAGLHPSVRNCPVTAADVSNSPVIFGPNRPRIRGATTRDTKLLRVKEQRIAIPSSEGIL